MDKEDWPLDEKSSPFGRLIRHQRMSQDRSLHDVSFTTKVDISTISRLEHGSTQATLATAVRLCRGLNISLDDVVHSMRLKEGGNFPEDEIDFTLTKPLLSMNDVDTFITYVLEDYEVGVQFSGVLLKKLYNEYIQKSNYQSDSPPLGEIDVRRIFSNIPLYRYSMQYPQGIDIHMIKEIYKRRGIIVQMDVDEYLKRIYANTNIMASSARDAIRRVSSASLERFKLKDVLQIDAEVPNSAFLGICWSAWEYEEEVARLQKEKWISLRQSGLDAQERELATFLILLSRWFFYLGSEHAFLEDLQREVQSNSLLNRAK